MSSTVQQQKNKNYNGTIVGAIFTASSLVLTLTFIIPLISMFLGRLVQDQAVHLLPIWPGIGQLAKITLRLLSAIMALVLFIFLLHVRYTIKRNRYVSRHRIAFFMFLAYFIVHPLGYYIYNGAGANLRSNDGQAFFSVLDSFPYSSCSFLILGGIIDLVKNMTRVSR